VYLVSYWVDDIDMLGGRSDNLCKRLCCMVFVAVDLRACGALAATPPTAGGKPVFRSEKRGGKSHFGSFL
jgi:hypothetical protein